MKDKSFLDTNVLIYCYSVSEPEKQMKAQTVANLPDIIISTQVLKELSSILRRKYRLDWSNIRAAIEETQTNFEVYVNTIDSIKAACDIAKQYQFSFYDSLIVAAALDSGCTTLFSEDLQHGQVINEMLVIKNPFI